MDYVELHFEYAVKKLCIGEKDVKTRLLEVWNSDLNLLTRNNNSHFNDYSDEIKKDWERIYKKLSKEKPVYRADGSIWRGSVEVTLEKIKNKTGSKIAGEIYKLTNDVKKFNIKNKI